MTEHDFNKDLPQILLIIIGISFIVLLIFAMDVEGTNAGKTEIVGRYKNCDIVRWTDPSMRYQYFLHCST